MHGNNTIAMHFVVTQFSSHSRSFHGRLSSTIVSLNAVVSLSPDGGSLLTR